MAIIIILFATFISLFVKDKRRYFLYLLVVFMPLNLGWIFFRYNGFMLMDYPLLVLMFTGLFKKGNKLYYRNSSFPLLAFIVWGFAGALQASIPQFAINEAFRIFRGYLIFLVMQNNVKTYKDVKIVINGLLAGIMIQGVMGFYQWRFGRMGLWFLGEVGFGFRSTGLFSHPNFLGNFLMLLIPIFLRLALFYKKNMKREILFFNMALLFGTIGLFTSYSRSAWIGLMVSSSIMFFLSIPSRKFHPRTRLPLFVGLLVALGFMAKYSTTIVGQFMEESGRNSAAEIRIPLIKVGLNMFQDNPITGVGMGNYLRKSRHYVKDEYVNIEKGITRHQLEHDMCHNSFVLIAAETGGVGLFLWLFYLFTIFKFGYKLIARSNFQYFANIGIGIMTGYVGLMVSFMASPDFRIHEINVTIFMLGGFLIALQRLDVVMKKKINLMKINGRTN